MGECAGVSRWERWWWLIIGLVVALSNGYSITNLGSLISFLLALFLWPLVLLGIDLHLAG